MEGGLRGGERGSPSPCSFGGRAEPPCTINKGSICAILFYLLNP